jgi:2,3-bisphosphoglycerate-dependent phosphoglycerate mutase
MKRLLLVRHCTSTGQDPSAPLSAAGHVQAVRLADYLETMGVQLIVSSPYTRAQQSITPLAQRLNLRVETDPRLAERRLSATPLRHWREAVRQAFENLDVSWPGGESSRAAMSRGRTAIDALLARPEQTQVAVTHGNLLTLILRSFEDHCCI